MGLRGLAGLRATRTSGPSSGAAGLRSEEGELGRGWRRKGLGPRRMKEGGRGGLVVLLGQEASWAKGREKKGVGWLG